MILQISMFAKSPFANWTSERPGSRMDIAMALEVTRGWESLRAYLTLVGLFL